VSLNRRNQTVWPRRPNGVRRRASASEVFTKGRVARPAGWLVRLVVLLVIAIPSLIITSPGYMAFADKLPDPTKVPSTVPEDTLIYAADNKTLLADLHPPGYQNTLYPISEIDTLLPEAVISIEDHNFYQEPGIVPQGIVRASVVDWQSRSTAQGASTITQQLVKLRLVGNGASLDRKVREALLAFQIERRYTKAEILEWYLNSVFFANTAWGTAAASKIYFHKQTKDLDLAQASMLAGVIRGPTLYNPLINWSSAKQRQKTVLDAMVGSANRGGYGGQYNLAVWPPRNPGSSMKIFTYTAAINSGKYTMTTPIADSRFVYRDPISGEAYSPVNYDGRTHGTCQLQACMGNSLNIPAVKVELGIGVSSVVEMARAMGAPPYQLHGTDANGFPNYTTDDPLNTYGPSLTLGGYGETPLQMATGASVLVTQGLLRQPYAIEVITRGDQLVYMHELDPGKRAVDARVAFIMQTIMSNDNNRAMIFGRNSLLTLRGRHVGVKTGTSDSFADAWTVGYTPHLVTAVWGGNADWRVKMTKKSYSYFVTSPTWSHFIQEATDAMGQGDEWYAEPAGLVHATCKGQTAYYMPGTHC